MVGKMVSLALCNGGGGRQIWAKMALRNFMDDPHDISIFCCRLWKTTVELSNQTTTFNVPKKVWRLLKNVRNRSAKIEFIYFALGPSAESNARDCKIQLGRIFVISILLSFGNLVTKVSSLSFLSPLYQGNALSLTITQYSQVNFQTKYKMTPRPSILAEVGLKKTYSFI